MKRKPDILTILAILLGLGITFSCYTDFTGHEDFSTSFVSQNQYQPKSPSKNQVKQSDVQKNQDIKEVDKLVVSNGTVKPIDE